MTRITQTAMICLLTLSAAYIMYCGAITLIHTFTTQINQ